MKQQKNRKGVIRPLTVGIFAGVLGILAGAMGTFYLDLSEKIVLPEYITQHIIKQREVNEDWLREEIYEMPCRWCHIKVDEKGWSVLAINNLLQLKDRVNTTDKEIIIPLFPTVFTPTNCDDLYYNTILESDIELGDKVLVIGAGSGSDAWVAWLKSQSPVYVIEINPMAIANIKTTARVGNFQVKPILGDIRDVNLPDDFNQFDFVLWNMPFLEKKGGGKVEEINFHDGDDGSILKSFLALLPSLLKKDGQAIIYNTTDALEFIDFPNLTTKGDENLLVYTFSNYTD